MVPRTRSAHMMICGCPSWRHFIHRHNRQRNIVTEGPVSQVSQSVNESQERRRAASRVPVHNIMHSVSRAGKWAMTETSVRGLGESSDGRADGHIRWHKTLAPDRPTPSAAERERRRTRSQATHRRVVVPLHSALCAGPLCRQRRRNRPLSTASNPP